MINHSKIFLVLILIFLLPNVYAQEFKSDQLEKTIKAGIKKAYPASVKIMGFDTVKHIQNSAQFSGVVVSADGHILTAAHAIQPYKIYKVLFPDGRNCWAVGLGRIALTGTATLPDAAMIKIITKGNWPYVDMAWSAALKVDEPCLSIAYPQDLNQSLPLVRFGRIAVVCDDLGFVQSTCAMELGDSGGALFDYSGRLIGIHSRCFKSEEVNCEVPVDLYRKYWSALNQPKNYTGLPETQDEIKADPMAAHIYTVPELKSLPSIFTKKAARFKSSQFLITSRVKNSEQKILGTLIIADDPKFKKSGAGSMLISKNSCVGNEPVVWLPKEGAVKAQVVFRSVTDDLVLLKIDRKLDGGIDIKAAKNDSLKFDQVGTILLSPRPDSLPKVSALGSTGFPLTLKFSMGYLGATSFIKEGKIVVSRVQQGSPAGMGGLKADDTLNSINHEQVNNLVELQRELKKYEPGDDIEIAASRNGKDTVMAVTLGLRPVASPNHNAEKFTGGKSIRRDGFAKIFGHDARITPEECGGPVIDVQGNFYGINIARFSRVVTLAVPVSQLRQFLLKALGDQRS
ncbi:trypsin-like peptidase domain-containing protein [Mucilaginibacter paludis]|uniref:PDZ/DHR/GLGF domain protein n=1 Tax=Mucilaginibacter paludis DSM 18603 TaxID=714943 RepID=H1Y094_9SPHI|nr:trypsin-like peptidase domain-containing protein [Mucilaginibacter paludis]EHQ28143.1 PDZ/DHR/GLGF domain protein [Mucilaginibacter paludis DSM 18603]